MASRAKIAFITAIYGDYEASCKPYRPQTIPADFICFTNLSDLHGTDGWIIDNTPYHYLNPSPLDTGKEHNSLANNKHTFNIAKYYKQSFQCIPRLKEYDIVVWLDATLEIIDSTVAERVCEYMKDHQILGWMHEMRGGCLKQEVEASNFDRYTSTRWFDQDQPYQDIFAQYSKYVSAGYTDDFWTPYEEKTGNPNFGVWITCFVAFRNKDDKVREFLEQWYSHTLQYTTQDQISFPFIVFSTGIIPHTLPDATIKGDRPHAKTAFYYKHPHGR